LAEFVDFSGWKMAALLAVQACGQIPDLRFSHVPPPIQPASIKRADFEGKSEEEAECTCIFIPYSYEAFVENLGWWLDK